MGADVQFQLYLHDNKKKDDEMRILICIFTIAGFLFIVEGCYTTSNFHSGNKWDDNLLFSIEKGKTDVKTIAQLFGVPQKKIIGDGQIWIYHNTSGRYFVYPNGQKTLVESENYSLTIWFDKSGIVSDYNLSYNMIEDPILKAFAKGYERKSKKP